MTKERPTTMFELSQHNAEIEAGGRFAPARPYVVGSGGTPPLPAPNYSIDHDNKEPPIGEDVNFVPQMETVAHGGSEFALAVPQPCPYATDEGCHLALNDIGPCLCGPAP